MRKPSHVHRQTPRSSPPAAGREEDRGSPPGQVGLRDGSGRAAALPMTRTHRAGTMALTGREMLCLIGSACLWLPLCAEVCTDDDDDDEDDGV